MKSKKIKPLSEIEWDTCWMAIRYAMGRQTIASAMLPAEIIKTYYHRFSDVQKRQIVRDLLDYLKDIEHFGDKNIDDKHWKKFLGILNTDCHYKIDLIDGSEITVFKIDEVIYPLDKSIDEPYQNWIVPSEILRKVSDKKCCSDCSCEEIQQPCEACENYYIILQGRKK